MNKCFYIMFLQVRKKYLIIKTIEIFNKRRTIISTPKCVSFSSAIFIIIHHQVAFGRLQFILCFSFSFFKFLKSNKTSNLGRLFFPFLLLRLISLSLYAFVFLSSIKSSRFAFAFLTLFFVALLVSLLLCLLLWVSSFVKIL